MHSVDHAQMAKILDITDFSPNVIPANCEMSRCILASLAERPFHIMKTRFAEAPHPFYQNVYRRAAEIDQEFADTIDCCVDV